MTVLSTTTINLPGGRRILGAGRCICAACGLEVSSVPEHPRRWKTFMVARTHGPTSSRCAGSRKMPLPWLAACGLPLWADMTDRDKGEALRFVTKADWERDWAYTRKNWPARYTGDGLADLAEIEPVGYWSARHASAVVGSLGERLESVPNPLAGMPLTLMRAHPATMREPLSQMAARVLGDEYDRLLAVA